MVFWNAVFMFATCASLCGQQVKVIEGLGTTMDVVLVNGLLREGAQIVVCGLGAPIVTTIRSLLTPHPMKVRNRRCMCRTV
jgi:translation initiation factor 5B